MNKTVEFGNRENLCIRLGFTINPKKFYLQFWITNIELGNFKRADTLQTSLNAFYKIFGKKESMSQTVLSTMTKEEIWNYISDVSIGMDEVRNRFRLLYDSGVYPIFGGQFSNQQRRDIFLIDSDRIRFIWQNDFGQPVNEAKISSKEFSDVFKEFRTYCEIQDLL